jgi:NitT/TauT family transport system substrate-binding protein
MMKLFAPLATIALLAAALPQAATAAESVKVGTANTLNDVPIVIAAEKGYFKDEGLDVSLVPFTSGAQEIAPLGRGEIDVGSGAMSAGFYNALAQGIGFKIVADKGHVEKGYEFQTVFIRKDLIDSGAFKSLKDLKGKKIAIPAPGVSTLSLLNEAAKAGGIKFDDINVVYLGFGPQIAAFKNKAVDGSLMIEPPATIIANQGAGVRFMNTQEFYPNQQIALVFYSELFIKNRPDVAVKFMKGYLRGIRTYNAALKGDKLAGPGAGEVIQLMAKHFKIDPKLAADIHSQAMHPNGDVNVASMRKDMEFLHSRGLIKDMVDLSKVVDLSFAQKASKELAAAGK